MASEEELTNPLVLDQSQKGIELEGAEGDFELDGVGLCLFTDGPDIRTEHNNNDQKQHTKASDHLKKNGS